jgi:pimeloyl-ACP methyl ester carboxylesterase
MKMQRRDLLKAAAVLGAAGLSTQSEPATAAKHERSTMATVEARDGTKLFCRSWGEGRPVLFAAAWMLNSQAWQYQMLPLSEASYRCIAFDRRGHGRSEDPGRNFDMDTLASDVARVMEAFDLRDATLVGHSLGCAEAVRYVANHGPSRVRSLVMVAPTTPCLLKSADNPDGIDPSFYVGLRAAIAKDFPGIIAANMRPFVTPETSQALLDWVIAMTQGNSLKAIIECNRTLAAADFRPELPKIALPTLLIHGTADVSAPIDITSRKTAALMPNAHLAVIEGAPHGLIYTHMDQVNGHILEFLRS